MGTNNARLSIIVIAVISAIIFGGLGFYLGKRTSPNPTLHTSPETINSTISPSNLPTSTSPIAITTPTISPKKIDIAPFRKLAAQTTDRFVTSDKFYIIDSNLIFWMRTQKTADDSYIYRLYKETQSNQLCQVEDSIAGPQRSCTDQSYQALFDKINAKDPNLGLSSEHSIEEAK